MCLPVWTFARSDAEGRSVVYTATARQLGHSVSLIQRLLHLLLDLPFVTHFIADVTVRYKGSIQDAPKLYSNAFVDYRLVSEFS